MRDIPVAVKSIRLLAFQGFAGAFVRFLGFVFCLNLQQGDLFFVFRAGVPQLIQLFLLDEGGRLHAFQFLYFCVCVLQPGLQVLQFADQGIVLLPQFLGFFNHFLHAGPVVGKKVYQRVHRQADGHADQSACQAVGGNLEQLHGGGGSLCPHRALLHPLDGAFLLLFKILQAAVPVQNTMKIISCGGTGVFQLLSHHVGSAVEIRFIPLVDCVS